MLCTTTWWAPRTKGQFPIWNLGFRNLQPPGCRAKFLPSCHRGMPSAPKWSHSSCFNYPTPELPGVCPHSPAKHEWVTKPSAKMISREPDELGVRKPCSSPCAAWNCSKGKIYRVNRTSHCYGAQASRMHAVPVRSLPPPAQVFFTNIFSGLEIQKRSSQVCLQALLVHQLGSSVFHKFRAPCSKSMGRHFSTTLEDPESLLRK